MTDIITAIIVGGLSLIGVIITNISSNHRIENKIEVNQAVMQNDLKHTNEEISQLRDEVRSHNDFARRVPVLEKDVKNIYHQLDELKEK